MGVDPLTEREPRFPRTETSSSRLSFSSWKPPNARTMALTAGLPSNELTFVVGVELNMLAGVVAREKEWAMEVKSFEPGPNVRAWSRVLPLSVSSLASSAACFAASAARFFTALAAWSMTMRSLARAAVHLVTLASPQGFSVLVTISWKKSVVSVSKSVVIFAWQWQKGRKSCLGQVGDLRDFLISCCIPFTTFWDRFL